MSEASPRLLQREKFIRVAGFFLMASPFFNLFFSIHNALGPNVKLTQPILEKILRELPIFIWLAAPVAIVTGFMMLKGRRSSWISVLGLLGVFIVFNFMNIRQDFKTGWFQPTLNLITNLSLFILVYAQEFHQTAQRKGLELLRAMREAKSNGPAVHFDNVGPWAQLIAITTTHVSMRAVIPPPPDLQSRLLELALNSNLVLKARYVQHQSKDGKDEYFFEFVEMDAGTRYRLEDWLVVKKYARFTAPSQAA